MNTFRLLHFVPVKSVRLFAILALLLALVPAAYALAQTPSATSSSAPTLHPALFLVGDSIMKTGTGNGEKGPWGWGSEIVSFFDPDKIHVYNEGRGGRASRSYIEEGLWAHVLKRTEPGDFVIVQFGHNDAKNSQNYPDRISIKGSGDETEEVENAKTGTKQAVHTYGWYLRQYVADAKAKGVTVILCSPVPRNTWVDGKIKRGFDGYAQWAAESAKASGAPFIDLNTLAADRYDELGQQKSATCFADSQHTTKVGARLNAEAVVAGLKQLKNSALADVLTATPPAPAVRVSPQPADATTSSATPAAETFEKAAASAGTAPPNTGAAISLPALYVLGDSTAANNPRSTTVKGWGTPFLAYFDPTKINVINAARGGRSARTYITEGLLDAVVAKLKPGDIVLIQFGHNDAYDINGPTGRGSLHGVGEETQEIDNTVTHKHEVVHSFGWYLRKFVDDIRSKGAQPIILTLTIRDRWNKDGTIERLPVDDLDLNNANRFHEPSIYSNWSAEVAKAAHVPLLDVHNCIADRYEREGPDIVSTYFNSPKDPTHRNPKGAAVDSELTVAALKALEGRAFDDYLSDQGRAVPPADAKYVFPNVATGK